MNIKDYLEERYRKRIDSATYPTTPWDANKGTEF